MYYKRILRIEFFLIIIIWGIMIEREFGQSKIPEGIMGVVPNAETFDSKNLNKQAASLPIPEMIYPINAATDVPIIPQFILKTVAGADRYEIQVANDHDFSCGFFSCSILSYSRWQFASPTTTEYLLEWFPSLPNNQTFQNNSVYYWRVRALNSNSGEQSDWSQPSKYTTLSTGSSISQPTLLSPDSNTSIPWLNIELKWNQVTNATWYQIQWSTSSTFNSFIYHWTRGDSPSLIINVKPKTTYYWRVIAFNDNGVSTFSIVRSFKTGGQVLLTDPIGTFDDGSGTDTYDNNLDLFWLIKPTNALPNSKIKLSFLSFDTEGGYDFVRIYDGGTTSSAILGKFDGTTIPESISSSGPSMLVRFTSDAAKTGKGWSANYECFWIPTAKEISDYIDQLSSIYKVPSVIVKSVAEQESGWRQFYDDGSPVFHDEKDINGNVYAKGWGLMQVTVPVNVEKIPLVLATDIREGVKQGENNFSVDYALVEVDVDSLMNYWKYNLEIGTRVLVAKKVAPESASGSGGAKDDARILENWYYPLAYYNGAVKYLGQSDYNANPKNDPKFNYPRYVGKNDDWKSKSIFPYQECIYNIIAQRYEIPTERKEFFGFHISVTLPGPAAVNSGGGHYDFVHPDFCFFDWAVYYQDGSVNVGNGGGKNNGCIPDYRPYPGKIVHIVPFGSPGITVSKIVSTAGIFNFSSTGNQTSLEIDFKSLNGSGSCTVDFLANGPNQTGFVGNTPNNISPYRWVISQDGLTSFVAELRFDSSQLPVRIANPSAIKVYSRSTTGLGLFTELPTTYNAMSNVVHVTVTNFGEFILGSDEPLTNVAVNNQISKNYILSQNYPNPFNPITTISYSIPRSGLVTLKVFDLLGREVATLVNEEKQPGNYEVKFDGTNLTSGVYLYRMQTGEYLATKKLLILK